MNLLLKFSLCLAKRIEVKNCFDSWLLFNTTNYVFLRILSL